MVITHYETWVFCDCVLLFVAQDKAGDKLICSLANSCSDYDSYLCTRISAERLLLFSRGKIDLLSILREPEIDEFYCAKVSNLSEDVIAVLVSHDEIPSDWFPDPGFYMPALSDEWWDNYRKTRSHM